MPYLEVNFDPFIALAKITNAPVSNPLNLINYVETQEPAVSVSVMGRISVR